MSLSATYNSALVITEQTVVYNVVLFEHGNPGSECVSKVENVSIGCYILVQEYNCSSHQEHSLIKKVLIRFGTVVDGLLFILLVLGWDQ